MKEFVKIECSLKDRILFLFTSLINKKFIHNLDIGCDINISKNVRKDKFDISSRSWDIKDAINDIPDEFDIPFFELNNKSDENVESNLK